MDPVSTVMAMFGGLLPIMWSVGPGTDVMKRIAAPMLGGIVTSFLLELAVCPVLYALWRRRSEKLDFAGLTVKVEMPFAAAFAAAAIQRFMVGGFAIVLRQ